MNKTIADMSDEETFGPEFHRMSFADAIENYQCSPWQFVTFQCNRFDAKFKPWQ